MSKSVANDEPRIKIRLFICLIIATISFASTASRVTLTLSLVAMIDSSIESTSTETSSTFTESTKSNVTSKLSAHHGRNASDQVAKFSPKDGDSKKVNNSPYQVKLTESMNDRLLEIVFLGGLMSPIPVGRAVERHGPRIIATILLFANAMSMSLIPLSFTWSIYAAACFIFIKGASTSPLYACASVLASHWSPKYEKTMFMAAVSAGSMISIITVNPLVGYICSLDFLGGWPLAFYAVGGLNFLVIGLVLLIITNDPIDHPYITTAEKEVILRERTTIDEFNEKSVPVREILTCGPVLALLLAQFSYYWFAALIATQVPQYFKSILHVSIAEDGFLSALPYVGAAVSLSIFSYSVDKLRATGRFSTTAIRKIFADLGFIFAPAFLMLSTMVGSNQWVVIACVCLAKVMGTAQVAGIMAVHLDLAPSYAGTLAGIVETVHNAAAMAMNHAAFYLVGNQPTLHHWTNFFLATAVICIIGTHYFALLGSSKLQPWDPTFKSEEKAIQEDQNGEMLYPTIFDPEIFVVDARSGSILRRHSLAPAVFELTQR